LLAKGVKLVVIKDGSNGSCAYTNSGDEICLGIIKAEIHKTFGSGDAYASGLLYGLFTGMPLLKAMELGTACASIVLSGKVSCSDSLPTLKQAEKFLNTHSLEPYQNIGGDS